MHYLAQKPGWNYWGLFMNNPDRSFYVREITRNIDEQINSVRRELANLVRIGIITDKSVDNRLYYQVDTKFKYYHALHEMFADDSEVVSGAKVSIDDWATRFRAATGCAGGGFCWDYGVRLN